MSLKLVSHRQNHTIMTLQLHNRKCIVKQLKCYILESKSARVFPFTEQLRYSMEKYSIKCHASSETHLFILYNVIHTVLPYICAYLWVRSGHLCAWLHILVHCPKMAISSMFKHPNTSGIHCYSRWKQDMVVIAVFSWLTSWEQHEDSPSADSVNVVKFAYSFSLSKKTSSYVCMYVFSFLKDS